MRFNFVTSARLAIAALSAFALAPASAQDKPTFEAAASTLEAQLQASVQELSELRERIAGEKLPLARELTALEGELSTLRQDFQQKTRLLDGRALDLSNLRTDTKVRQDEAAYLSNLLGEYLRNLESRLHIAELQRYAEPLKAAKLAAENTQLTRADVFAAQADAVRTSLDRLLEGVGGTRFPGTAVDGSGLVRKGSFVMVGPAAIFASGDGQAVGTAEQRLGSLEPAIIGFATPERAQQAAALVTHGAGVFPLDPTLGNAHKIEATQETLWEHIKKGGPVMWPIFILAGLALLVALYKWVRLMLVRSPSPASVRGVLAAVAARDQSAAKQAAQAVAGPSGVMLRAGVEHLAEPRELIEEVMYEQVLATRLKLQGLLPFIAITASSAPLLGLLGTVTGIMNTFSLMTVFGTGDVKTLSSGISEALITTEYGLYVAIPALLLHAFLSRKARRQTDGMEKAALAFLNQVGRTPLRVEREAPELALEDGDDQGHPSARPAASASQLQDALASLLAPAIRTSLEQAGRAH